MDWSKLTSVPVGGGVSNIQLTEAEVEAYITNGAINLFSGTTLDGKNIATKQYVTTQGYLTSVGYSDLTGAPSDDITAGLLIDWAGNTLNVVSDLSQYDNSVSAFLTAADLPVGAVYELTVTKTGVNIWNGSGTTTSGVATIYLTDDGLASGNALFSNVYSVQATSANNTTSAIAVPVASIKSVSADKKTLTIEPTPSA